ncbi:PqiB family protein [Psychromonas aquimarina]|uniref:PqiB family protein n=1 Tax=Psychromonas aquimarina TaxID=444919 RepID=UPI000405E9D5|nr:MlaD family protein [Psychromonas aquimarina]
MNEHFSENQAQIVKTRSISPIWFLPVVAAVLGLWILFQNITHANVQVKIHFQKADSIIVDKTKIRYKGVIVGTVKKIELDSASGVNVIAEIESHATFMLREQTQFWLVSPKASLTSISGLDTLFSGSYINLEPGDGEEATVFDAIDEEPISIPDNALLVSLKSDSAGSVSVGTPIFFKKIKVGEIVQVRLDDSGRHVNIKAFVESDYSHLVKSASKFWNISGLRANISRAGIDVNLDSITSLIAGGITFSSPQKSTAASAETQFELYENIDKSEAGQTIELTVNNINNLPKGAGILFKGHGIGRITDIEYSLEQKQFIAQATINPQFSEMITQGAQFWVEKTALSFSKIKNLGNIITGDYVAFAPAADAEVAQKASSFALQQSRLPVSPALDLMLLTEDATGLNAGDPVSYQGIKIGSIRSLDFAENGRFIETSISIDSSYQYLINKNSQFYLLSGVNMKASLQGIEMQSTPLEHLLSGGIGLYNAEPVKKSAKNTLLDKNLRFRLYPSRALAEVGKNVFSKPLILSVLSKQLPAVSEGSPVYYHKLPIGEVIGFSIDNSGLMKTELSIKGQYRHLIKEQSIFWNISGFNVDAGLGGIEIQAESLLTIVKGGIAVDHGKKDIDNKYANGSYKLFSSYEKAAKPPTVITLLFDQANELQVGSKLRLKGLVIGRITELTLSSKGKVQAKVNVKAEFAAQTARKGSRFWVVSSDISLAGAKNLSTLVSGVFINVEPGKGAPATEFTGEVKAPIIERSKTGLPLILLTDNAGSTDINSPVYHRQIQIGEVMSKQLSSDASGVEIAVNIYPEYSHLIRENSIFWPASGFNLNVGITGVALKSTSLTSLIKGGISMSTPDNKPLQEMSDAFARFELKKEFNESWLNWKLAIPKP